MNYRVITEDAGSEDVPLYVHPEWAEQWPWLLQATTGRGRDNFDLSFFGTAPAGVIQSRWRAIREASRFPAIVHAHQVHGAKVLFHKHAHGGVNIADDADGHVMMSSGGLLAVSVADCVPIFLVDPELKAIGLLHAGWRGVAAGILERGVELLIEKGSSAASLYLHFGPSICGQCYEVGREVFEGVGLVAPADQACINLRQVLADRAVALGIRAERLTLSQWCTRCDNGEFFSHRAGDRERQMGLLGIRPQ